MVRHSLTLYIFMICWFLFQKSNFWSDGSLLFSINVSVCKLIKLIVQKMLTLWLVYNFVSKTYFQVIFTHLIPFCIFTLINHFWIVNQLKLVQNVFFNLYLFFFFSDDCQTFIKVVEMSCRAVADPIKLIFFDNKEFFRFLLLC